MLDLHFFFPITPHYDVYYDFLRRELLEQLFFREYMVETVGTYHIVHQFQGRPILPQEVNWLTKSYDAICYYSEFHAFTSAEVQKF
jgi:hypothetical protein